MEVQFDQHFLKSEGALYQIVKAVETSSEDNICEIGAGNCVLTKELLKQNPKQLTSFEIDPQFTELLTQLKENHSNFEFVLESALTAQLTSYTKVVGNIPYGITEPLYEKILENRVPIAVFLHGKKFYDTITTKSQSKWYHFVNAFYNIEKITGVPGDLFEPPTKVSSTVVKLTLKEDATPYELILQELFYKRIRTTQNALIFACVDILKLPKKTIKQQIVLPSELVSKQLSSISNEEFTIVLEQLMKVLLNRNEKS